MKPAVNQKQLHEGREFMSNPLQYYAPDSSRAAN